MRASLSVDCSVSQETVQAEGRCNGKVNAAARSRLELKAKGDELTSSGTPQTHSLRPRKGFEAESPLS